MHPRAQYWLYGGTALVLIVLGVAAFVVWPGADQQPVVSAREPTARDDMPEVPDEGPEADEATAPSDNVAKGDQEEAGSAAVKEEAPAEPEALDEERFVEVAARIRVWQEAIADTPEGRRKLDDLVKGLLNSERLTPSDLEAFGERVGLEAMDRLDARIDERVAEFGQRHYHVEAKPTKGTRVIAQGEPHSAEGDEDQ